MLLDSVSGLQGLYHSLLQFLKSREDSASFVAEVDGSPSPYDEFLEGLRIEKTGGPMQLRISEDRWLELGGSAEDIERFGQKFSGLEINNHTHWYANPKSLVIEADDTWGNAQVAATKPEA